MTVFKNLIGKRINGIFVNDDHTILVFRSTGGDLHPYSISGDCCNTVYINHLQGVNVIGEGNVFDLIRGALVLSAEDKEWKPAIQQEGEEFYEVVEDGFFTICTDRGYIDLELRNEHNGYYGGHIDEYDDISKEEISELIPLIEDF
jgi:hypothetical protein